MAFPTIVQATVQKEKKDSKLGVGVKVENDILVVNSIASGSPFEGTGLKVGYEVLTINGSTGIKNAKEAVSILKEAVGEVSIITCSGSSSKAFQVALVKNSDGFAAGIRLGPFLDNLVCVDRIMRAGSFANSVIKEGDIVLTVNGTTVANPAVATNMLRKNSDQSVIAICYLSRSDLLENAFKSMVAKDSKSWYPLSWSAPDIANIGIRRSAFGKREGDVDIKFGPDWTCSVAYPWLFLVAQRDITKLAGDFQRGDIFYSNLYKDELLPRVAQINEFVERNLAALQEQVQEAKPATKNPQDDVVEKLTKLSTLHTSGQLTKEEFAVAKAKLLGLL